nr:EpsG family protein [uncultured Cetobacterium sp.]
MLLFVIGIFILGLGLVETKVENERYRNRMLIFTMVGIGVLLAFRGFLGWDWYFYYPSFMHGSYIYEKGYMIYTKLIGGIYKNYIFYQSINVIIDFSILYVIFKRYCKYPLLTFAIFFMVQGLPMEVDLMRNMKAILLFMLSLKYIEERNIYMFLLLNIIGVSFHTSAIIYFPMYFLLNRDYKKEVVISIFLVGTIIYFFNVDFIKVGLKNIALFFPEGLEKKITSYISILPENLNRGFNFFYLERLILFILALLYEKNRVLKNSAYMYIGLFLFTSELSIVSLRFGIMFIYSLWIIFSRIIEKEKSFILYIFIVFIATYRSYNYLFFSGNKINYKYESVITKDLDYEKREKELIKSKKNLKETHGKELLIQY